MLGMIVQFCTRLCRSFGHGDAQDSVRNLPQNSLGLFTLSRHLSWTQTALTLQPARRSALASSFNPALKVVVGAPQIKKRSDEGKLNIQFMGRVDHLDERLRPYKVSLDNCQCSPAIQNSHM